MGTKSLRQGFGIEGKVGTYGLKSPIIVGFIPDFEINISTAVHPGLVYRGEFFLRIELRCPKDNRLASEFNRFTMYNFAILRELETLIWTRGSLEELSKLYKMMDAFSPSCTFDRGKVVEFFKVIRSKAFWRKVLSS